MADGTVAGRARWITPEMRVERKSRAQPYFIVEGGLEELYEKKLITIRPQGCQVLLRAIVPESDCTELGTDGYNARAAVAHEVLLMGSGCKKWMDDHAVPDGERIRIGDHCFVVSAAANRLSKNDPGTRLWSTHVEDITQAWAPPVVAG